MVCPRCGQAKTRKNGKDRRGTQVYACTVCACTFTALTARPCSGYRNSTWADSPSASRRPRSLIRGVVPQAVARMRFVL